MLMKLPVTNATGRTSRGKYTFVTRFLSLMMAEQPAERQVEKNIQGIRATKRKRWYFSIPARRMTENTRV